MRRFLPICVLAGSLLAAGAPAMADVKVKSKKIEASYWGGVRSDDGEAVLSRATIKPSAKLSLSKRWKTDVALRLEFADDDVGLGSIETYSELSQSLLRSNTTRLEIDRATLNYKKGKTRLTLGKQTMAWGVLDGIQVTDRFDPVRRRDFVFSETRPERISRWGARWQQKRGDWAFDAGVSVDPTVSQLALQGDVFSPTSPRYRAGLAITTAPIALTVQDRGEYWQDATYGLRATRDMGASTLSALWFSGPETDPVYGLSAAEPGAVELRYPRRDLFGVSFDRAAGPVVLRFEAAHIPDQPLNVVPIVPTDIFRIDDRARTLAGVGLDWNAPGDVFLNAQIAVDHFDARQSDLFGPQMDTIYTVKLRRAFKNDLVKLNAELIGSAEGSDGAFSLDLSYDVTDNVSVSIGTNQLFGNQRGTFGQFDDQDRIWTRLKFSM